jgi:hypothetical protein
LAGVIPAAFDFYATGAGVNNAMVAIAFAAIALLSP